MRRQKMLLLLLVVKLAVAAVEDNDVLTRDPYEYQFKVDDPKTSNRYEIAESGDPDIVKGSYRIALPDGRTQVVTYEVHPEKGFDAKVTYEGTAQYPDSPGYVPSAYGPPEPIRPGYAKYKRQLQVRTPKKKIGKKVREQRKIVSSPKRKGVEKNDDLLTASSDTAFAPVRTSAKPEPKRVEQKKPEPKLKIQHKELKPKTVEKKKVEFYDTEETPQAEPLSLQQNSRPTNKKKRKPEYRPDFLIKEEKQLQSAEEESQTELEDLVEPPLELLEPFEAQKEEENPILKTSLIQQGTPLKLEYVTLSSEEGFNDRNKEPHYQEYNYPRSKPIFEYGDKESNKKVDEFVSTIGPNLPPLVIHEAVPTKSVNTPEVYHINYVSGYEGKVFESPRDAFDDLADAVFSESIDDPKEQQQEIQTEAKSQQQASTGNGNTFSIVDYTNEIKPRSQNSESVFTAPTSTEAISKNHKKRKINESDYYAKKDKPNALPTIYRSQLKFLPIVENKKPLLIEENHQSSPNEEVVKIIEERKEPVILPLLNSQASTLSPEKKVYVEHDAAVKDEIISLEDDVYSKIYEEFPPITTRRPRYKIIRKVRQPKKYQPAHSGGKVKLVYKEEGFVPEYVPRF